MTTATTAQTTLPMTAPITTVTAADVDRAVAVLTLAFGTDPAARWAYPDPAQYLTYWPAFIRAFAGAAIDQGSGYAAANYAGVALWLPPGTGPDEDELAALIQRSIPAHDQDDFFAVVEQMGANHPHAPHWYLPLIGVEPTRQGRGVGSTLLAHALRRCDDDQLPAYLEATSTGSRALYERHGFATLTTIQVGASPPIWPMLRKPQRAAPR